MICWYKCVLEFHFPFPGTFCRRGQISESYSKRIVNCSKSMLLVFFIWTVFGKTFLYDSASRWFCIFPFRKCSVYWKQIGKALTFLARFPYKYCIRRRFNRRKFFCRFKKIELAYRLGHAPLNFQHWYVASFCGLTSSASLTHT